MASALDMIRASNGQQPAATEQDADLQEWLDECEQMEPDRIERYRVAREFYEGDHNVELTDRAREFLERSGVRFAENFCEPMVDMVGERLSVTGFDPQIGDEEGGDAAKALAEWLDRSFWRANRLDETSGVVHSIALSRGDSFGIIGYDNAAGRPTFSYNPPEQVKAVYAADDPDRMEYAVKVWTGRIVGPSNPDGRPVCRMNIYHPDRIERWFKLHSTTGRGGWSQWMDEPAEDGTPAAWPTPWVDTTGAPLGIPVVHFRNRAQGEQYGRSELAGVIPQQMQLNKQVLDLITILDNQSWPQRWATGVDPTSADFKTAPGEVWVSNSKDAAFGQMDPAEVSGGIAAIENTLSRMARRSGMPLHVLTGGDAPSGESIKSSESRLVKRCQDRAISFGNRWEDAALMAIRLAALAGTLPVDADPATVTLDALWDSPESRDDLAEAQTAVLYESLGVSKRTLLARLGFDPDQEITRKADEAEEAHAHAAKFFDGTDPSEPDVSPADQQDQPPPAS